MNQSLINDLYKFYFKPKQKNANSLKQSKTPKDNIDLEKIKLEMFNAPNGQKIQRLWNGDDTSMHRSADLALFGYLVHYTKGDYQIVDTML